MVHSGARSPIEVGTVIAGTYAIERLVGKGGMGSVFLASHARLPGKKVAIKVLHAEVGDSESLARFKREAEIASRLGHANIVEVHDFNELPDGTPYLVLEFLEGESLAARLARGPLTLDQTVAIVRQMGSALAAAHREGIVHRDLKPANVFLVPYEADGFIGERAKVLDFGISKIRGSQTIKTQEASILGTPQYMSPEQALGNHAAIDARTDVFALGAMVYEMLGGRPAFGGASVPEVVFKVVYEEAPPLSERVPGLPAHVLAAIARALAKKADDRFDDVVAFVEALSGQPLVTGRRAIDAAGLAPATPISEKKATREAFASTIGSGDHAQSLGMDATVASGAHAPAPVVAAATAPPTIAVAQPRGKGGVIIAAIAVVALAAVAIVYLVTQKPATTAAPAAAPAPVAIDAGALAAVTVDAGTLAAVTVDAAAKAPVVAPDAGVKKPIKHDAPVQTDPPPSGEVLECRKLLGGDPEDALRCANRVLEKDRRAFEAHVIRTMAYCAMDDQERAQSAIRKLNGRPAQRRRAAAFCSKQGYELQ